MISHLLNSFFIGAIFLDMLERRFPTNFQNFIIGLSYNSIYYFSKLQIFFGQIKRHVDIIIENNPTLLKIKQKLEGFILKPSCQKVRRYFVKNSKLYNSCDKDIAEPDFIILSSLSSDKKYMNKKIIYNKNDAINNDDINNDDINNDDILIDENSGINFLLIEFKVGDNQTHKIDLKTEDYNYYIIGNKFTKDFFIFYINEYLKFNIDIKDTDKCSLKLIDHNVNKIELDFTDKNESVLLEKNGYKLLITNDNK
jgi:hypothetical protein